MYATFLRKKKIQSNRARIKKYTQFLIWLNTTKMTVIETNKNTGNQKLNARINQKKANRCVDCLHFFNININIPM